MSKHRGPFFSLSARGSVGKQLTIRRSRGRQVGVQFSKPGGTASSGQLAVRSIVSDLGIFWQTLSAAQRAAWNEYARSVVRRAFGYEIYTSFNFALARSGFPFQAWPPGYPVGASVWELDGLGDLMIILSPVAGVFGLFEVAVDGSVSPSGGAAADTYFELDPDSDVRPR
jgi:hypothetical protein